MRKIKFITDFISIEKFCGNYTLRLHGRKSLSKYSLWNVEYYKNRNDLVMSKFCERNIIFMITIV